mmetsp:Transcript_47064/g.68769  ORF Transcript_47064/g.68769 Transcript_47064/m.68769 type:complete len:151 (+) Transcript_47064:93-545(+)|eukprot:CAMPEP_0194583802 /NCGR_PEP_ID=MMETSP0292-20121207/16603_1 /TAXON_ID=39354 /ORGANISM="Heterosigma akashiwo, Strain CCMP2393" /LENGTH=150 /DNA_ID=CAMNT_0039438587 /DNA_START=104 /DNA_END=556 /DNA_ORIENTATION=-
MYGSLPSPPVDDVEIIRWRELGNTSSSFERVHEYAHVIYTVETPLGLNYGTSVYYHQVCTNTVLEWKNRWISDAHLLEFSTLSFSRFRLEQLLVVVVAVLLVFGVWAGDPSHHVIDTFLIDGFSVDGNIAANSEPLSNSKENVLDLSFFV